MVIIHDSSPPPTPALADSQDKQIEQTNGLILAEEQLRAREKEVDLDLVDQLRALMRAEFQIHSDKYAPNHYEEIMNPNSAYTCWRYISHKMGNINEAFELMKSSLSWRKETAIDDLDRSELIKEFWHFTPIPMSGKDREGNCLLYVLGKNYRKPNGKLKAYIPKFCANNLFGWDRGHDLDLSRLHVVFDVSDTGYRNIDLDFMSWLLSVKDFLPSRWHRFSVVGIPFIVRPLIHMIISWLPDNYRQLVHLGTFQALVREAIDEDNLPVEVGGTCSESSYKLAPLDAPWASESAVFSQTEMLKYVEECILMNDTKRGQMRQLQMDHEKKLLQDKQQHQQ